MTNAEIYDLKAERQGRLSLSSNERNLSPGEVSPGTSYGGEGGDGVDEETKNYVDSKTEASRAQNDARFAEVLGMLGQIRTELAHAPQMRSIIWTVVNSVAVGVFAILGVTLTVIYIAGDRFANGVGAASISVTQAIEAQKAAEETAEKVEALSAKFDERDQALNAKVDTLMDIMGERARE